jgi:uncharacterized membrane protein YhaH (DUF805 family)
MTFQGNTAGRVSQGKYWLLFGIYMIAVPALLIGGFVMMLQGSIGAGALMILSIIPLGIYWRVIMMRRCRDIGWPAFLPWVIFGLQMILPFVTGQSFLTAPEPGDYSALTLPMSLVMVDFAFSIVIGCISGTRDQAFDFDAMRESARADYGGASSASETDRFDDAIARALDAQRRGESILDGPPRAAQPAPGPGRPVPTFGRRVV